MSSLAEALQAASALQRRGNGAAAEELLRRIRAQVPAPPDATYLLGVVLAKRGDSSAAEPYLREAAALRPDAPDFRAGYGNLLFGRQRYREAATEFAAAVELKPDFFVAHNNLGRTLCHLGELESALRSWRRAAALKRGTPLAPLPGHPAPAPEAWGMETFRTTSQSKLAHDIEQLEWLLGQNLLDARFVPALDAFRRTLAEIEAGGQAAPYITFNAAQQRRMDGIYNRLLHWPEIPALPGSALGDALRADEIESAYRASGPGIVHVDGLLRADALAALRRFCLESTIWFDFRHHGQYVGAYVNEGFLCDLLVQIAQDLRLRFPGIFKDHRLRLMWAYKYDSRQSGIRIHADAAAVNVNFWITPDTANLDSASGGLVVWDKEAPRDWDFLKFNRDQETILRFLAESGARPVTIPYRENRAVIFNSDLFHRTDSFRFREGYENRRINVTMLFGDRLA